MISELDHCTSYAPISHGRMIFLRENVVFINKSLDKETFFVSFVYFVIVKEAFCNTDAGMKVRGADRNKKKLFKMATDPEIAGV